jgi:hypothetical protein
MKVQLGSNSTFTTAGKSLTIIGDHCYAYSGIRQVSSTELDLLDFTTGKEYIEAKLNVTNSGNLSFDEDYYFRVYFNEIEVYAVLLEQPKVMNTSPYVPLLIPSNTSVRVTADNVSDSDTRKISCQLIGKLHDN